MEKPKKKPGQSNADLANSLIAKAKAPTASKEKLNVNSFSSIKKTSSKPQPSQKVDVPNSTLNPRPTDPVQTQPDTSSKLLKDQSAFQQVLGLKPSQALAAVGLGALPGLVSSIGSIAAVTGKTAVQKAAQVGTTDILGNTFSSGTAGQIAVNTATTVKTTSWITGLAKALTSPQAIAGSLVATIGSYPFAGFIKEEALQTLGFATKTAIDNADEQGIEEAIAFQEELLNPSLWNQIKAGIPFANVLSSLDDFYESAKIKLEVDKRIIEDKKKEVVGETPDEKWQRVKEEEAEAEKASVDYYNQERKKLLAWEAEAKKNQREEEAKFWAKEREKQRKLEEADRLAQQKYWEAYRKESQKAQDNSRPSKLNFGLI